MMTFTRNIPELPCLTIHRDGVISQGNMSIFLTATEFKFFDLLCEHFPTPLTPDDLIPEMYIGAHEPDNAYNNIRVFAWKARVKLKRLGINIRCRWGMGYRLEAWTK